jgi:RNA polymerase sigma-70 factor (sigma-E family)
VNGVIFSGSTACPTIDGGNLAVAVVDVRDADDTSDEPYRPSHRTPEQRTGRSYRTVDGQDVLQTRRTVPAMRDSDEFDSFYADTSRRVLGQVYAMTGNLSEAEDAVAEAYARAWQRWSQVSQAHAPEAWVRTVASRIAVSNWRKAVNRLRAHRRSALDSRDPGGLGPDHVALVSALRKISADQRRVVVLHYLADLTVEEISREVGAPTGTVKAWLARGRQAMSRYLSEPQEEASRGA